MMKIEYYREFLALADIGNFLAAADYLYMSQSTLSRHIKSLEDEYGVMLFDRSTHSMEITPEGELLLLYAKRIVDLYDNMKQQLLTDGEKEKNGQGLSFAYATYSMDAYSISEFLLGFQKKYPEIPISCVDSVKRITWNIIQYDFTFLCETAEEMQTNNYGRLRIDTDELVVVVSKDHPLAKKERISFGELKNQNFLLTSQGSWLRDWCINECSRCGFAPRELFTGLEGHNLIDMVIRGYGISILKRKAAEHIYSGQIAIISLTPVREIYINMVYLKRSLTPSADCFVHYIEAFLKKERKLERYGK